MEGVRGIRPTTREELEGARTPCERCGTPLLLVDIVSIDPRDPERRVWWQAAPWCEHTPARCTHARTAG